MLYPNMCKLGRRDQERLGCQWLWFGHRLQILGRAVAFWVSKTVGLTACREERCQAEEAQSVPWPEVAEHGERTLDGLSGFRWCWDPLLVSL